MNDEVSMKDLVGYIAKALVDEVDRIEINEITGNQTNIIELKVAKEDIGKVALQRGPLVYCAEWIDNNGKTSNLILPKSSSFSIEYKPELLNGLVVINSKAIAIEISSDGQEVTTVTQPFMAIPYYAWAHRGKGEMAVWFPQRIKNLDLVTVDADQRNPGD